MAFRLNLNFRAPWAIFVEDSDIVIEGDFPPEGLVRNIGSDIASTTTLTRDDPIIQWLGGTLETVTFTATLFADNATESNEAKLEQIINLTKRDENLGHPPIVNFIHGSITLRSIVQSVGGIRYGDLREEGGYRRIDLEISLVKFSPVSPIVTDPTALEPSTVFHVARDGETWESIAAEEYDQPIKGFKIKNIHPEIEDPQPGDIITILPIEHSKISGSNQLDAIAMTNSDEDVALRREAFDDVAERFSFIQSLGLNNG